MNELPPVPAAQLPPVPAAVRSSPAIAVQSTPRSDARSAAVQAREKRRAERAKQELLDREREESFETWRIAQQANEGDTGIVEAMLESSDEDDDVRRVSCASLNMGNDGLEAQLAAEKLALEAEEEERNKLIAKLSPPAQDQRASTVDGTPRSNARLQAMQQREQRRAEREQQELLDRERDQSFEAWDAAEAEAGTEPLEGCGSDGELDEQELSIDVSRPLSIDVTKGISGLEEQLALEKLALEGEERERLRLIAQLSPPEPLAAGEEEPEPVPEPEPEPETKELRVINPEDKGKFVTQFIVPERSGKLLVNYCGQTAAVWEPQSNSWLCRWVCLCNNFIYIFVEKQDTAPEDIVLVDDSYAVCTSERAEFKIHNRHTAARKMSFRAQTDDEHRCRQNSFAGLDGAQMQSTALSASSNHNDDEGPAAAWVASISESQTAFLTAERFVNRVLPTWVLDEDVGSCFGCHENFNWHRKRHHCRTCGNLFCRHCANREKQLPRHWMPNSTDQTVRVCVACASVLEHLVLMSMSKMI